MTKIVGIGAGGHARVLLDLARRQKGINVVGLITRSADSKGTLDGTTILGGEELLPSLLKQGVRGVFIG